jgi:hypothetical protein
MFKMILVFVLVSIIIAGGIQIFRNMSGKEKWTLTKIVGYAIMCSGIAISILSAIVVLF